MTTPDVDLFADMTSEATDSTETNTSDAATTAEMTSESSESTDGESEQTPVQTVDSVPDGAVSVTDFAKHITQYLMRQKFEAGEDMDGSEFTVPAAVYQTVKASRDRIPHVLVKGEGDSEPRAYILLDEATTWWLSRREKLATRGTGAGRASNRSAEDNLELLKGAVERDLYAADRLAMWTLKKEQTAKLIEKYKGFLKEQNVSDETISLALQEGQDNYAAEKAAKESQKAKKGDSATSDGE